MVFLRAGQQPGLCPSRQTLLGSPLLTPANRVGEYGVSMGSFVKGRLPERYYTWAACPPASAQGMENLHAPFVHDSSKLPRAS